MKRISLIMATVLSATAIAAQNTITNPLFWADVPDPDIIRVGDDYWLTTTTMHLMPGAPIMHSRDLVNWQTVSYLFDTLNDNTKYDLLGGTVYGRGQWATSLRYYKGSYYALFSPNDDPHRSYLYTTKDPRKGWVLHSRMNHFHDSSLFFDDDGKCYVFSGTGQLTELNDDLTGIREGGVSKTIFERDSTETGLLEGSRALKVDGRYYLIMVSWPNGKPRRQVCYRADSLLGPWEKKVILESEYGGFSYVGQGTIVDDINGNWYGLIFQDRGAIGRVPLLMPCHWIDGWPMLGDKDGHVPTMMTVPVGEKTDVTQSLVVSDPFDGKTLDINHWQWNHNPINSAWMMTGKALRLTTARVAENIYLAPNTLSQRMEGPECSAYVDIDFSHLKDGDAAGFAAFNDHCGQLEIRRQGRKTYLRQVNTIVTFSDKDHKVTSVAREEKASAELPGKHIFLRIDGDFRPGTDKASFFYSRNGKDWTAFGQEMQMRFDFTRFFMGTRYALFCYATKQTGGYAEFKNFTYDKKR